jgi:hypothetical protein
MVRHDPRAAAASCCALAEPHGRDQAPIELGAHEVVFRFELPYRTSPSVVRPWSAPDATARHAALASLPLWRYQDIEVIPLAGNGNDPGSDEPTREELRRLYPLGG